MHTVKEHARNEVIFGIWFDMTLTDINHQIVVAIVGTCKHCTLSFCQKHRLPETHSCSQMESCRQEHFKRNEEKGLGQQAQGAKINKV